MFSREKLKKWKEQKVLSVKKEQKPASEKKMWVSVEDNNNVTPVVQSIVSLTSSLVVKMLTVLVSTISNSQVFLLKKCE